MDRFFLESPADLARNTRMSHYPDELQYGKTKCFYCNRTGGVPYLMVGDELHCSRCFEDLTPEEFRVWLEDSPFIVEYIAAVRTEGAAQSAQPLCCEPSRAA